MKGEIKLNNGGESGWRRWLASAIFSNGGVINIWPASAG